MAQKLKSGVFVLFLTALCLLVAEGGGRLLIKYVELKRPSGIFAEKILSHQEPMLGFGLRKGVSEDMGGWTVKTNLLGFRSSEFTFEKPSDEYRIVIVGGSTVFGWGVNETQTIPAFLQSKISNYAGKKVRVINAGVPWYASWHEAALILFKVMEIKPDWIISVDGLNDTAQGTAPTWEPVSMGYLDPPTKVAMERLHSKISDRSFLASLLSHSQTYTYFSAKMKARAGVSTGVYHPELWEQYVNLKERIQAMASQQGIRFTTFFQPVIVEGKSLTNEEMAKNETNMKLPEFAQVFRQTYLAGEQKALNSKKISFFSLKDAFKNVTETIYIDGQHYNQKGNELLAEKIYQLEIAPHLRNVFETNSPKS